MRTCAWMKKKKKKITKKMCAQVSVHVSASLILLRSLLPSDDLRRDLEAIGLLELHTYGLGRPS